MLAGSRGAGNWKHTLVVVWLAQFLTVVGFSFVFPFMPLFVQELGVRDPSNAAFWSGLASVAMSASLFLSGPLWGIVGDRYGRKKNMLRALFGASVLLALTGAVANVQQLVLLRFFSGWFTGVTATGMALVAAGTPRERMATSMGTLQMALFTGMTLGPLLGGFAAGLVGFRFAFVISGAMLAFAGFAVLFFAREHFQRPADLQEMHPRAYLRDFVALVRAKEMLSVLAVLFLVQMAPVVTYPVLPLFIGEVSPGSSSTVLTGVVFAVMGMSSAIASLSVARFGGRVGLRPILLGSALLAGFVYLAMPVVQHAYQIMLIIGGIGLFAGAMTSSANAMIGMSVRSGHHGRAYGAVQSVSSLAFGLGPFIGGVLAQGVGLRPVFLLSSLLFLVVALVVWRFIGLAERVERREEALRIGRT